MRKPKAALFALTTLLALPAAGQDDQLQDPEACVLAVDKNPRYRQLAEKLPFDATVAPSLKLIANKQKATTKEKDLLSAYSEEREKCLDLGNEFRQKIFSPDVLALISTYRKDILGVFADLYSGSITFGLAVESRFSIATNFMRDFDALGKRDETQAVAAEQQLDAERHRRATEIIDAEAKRKEEQALPEQQVEQQ
ncbi:hypothetical protein MCEMIEM13_02827 [Comamonadaceae bacterium]